MRIIKTLTVATAITAWLAGSALASTLDSAKEKGYVNIGVSGKVVGFSAPDAKGEWTGIDVDYGRAIAAATLIMFCSATPALMKESPRAACSGSNAMNPRSPVMKTSRFEAERDTMASQNCFLMTQPPPVHAMPA